MEVKFGATVSYFLWSLLAGGVLALSYDFLRSSRRLFKTSVFGVNLEDICFFLLAGLLLFWIAYDKNNGRLRFQGFIGAILGFLIYRKIFKDKLVQAMVWLYEQTVRLLVFVLKIILFPIRIVYKVLAKPFLVIGWYSRQGMNRAESMARTIARRRKFLKKCQASERKMEQKGKKNKGAKTENFR